MNNTKRFGLVALWLFLLPAFAAPQDKLEIFVQLGHNNEVRSVAFSPDGRTMVSGSRDYTVKLWDVASGRELRTLSGHGSFVWAVAFSPDGRTVVSGSSDQTLKLWDVATGRELRTLRGHGDWIHAVAFSPDGRTVVSGSEDNTLKLWDVVTGRELKTLSGHGRAVHAVAFSPDGRTVVSGSADDTLKLWDVVSERQLLTLRGHGGSVLAIAFSPNGRTVVSGSSDQTLKLWDVASGRELRTLSGHADEINAVAFSPDGRTVVSGSEDNILKLWDVTSGRELRTLRGHGGSVLAVAFSPDGRTVVSGSGDYTLKLWDVASGRELKTLSGHGRAVRAVALAPDGRTVVSGSIYNTLKLWDVASGRELRPLRGHDKSAIAVAFSPDGHTVVSGSSDQTLKLWDVATGRELRTLRGHGESVFAVAFSPDGRTVVSGSKDNTLKLWDVATGRELRTLIGHRNDVKAVAFSPDGRTVVSGSEDNTLRLWDVASGRELRTLSGHGKTIFAVAFSPDGRTVVSGSEDNTLKLWDVASGRELRTLRGHGSWVLAVAFTPDSRTLVSGSWDSSIRLWEATTGKERALLESFKDGEWIAITPEGYFNASKNGPAHLNIRRGQNVYGVDQFYDVFYRPDIVELALKGEDISKLAPLNLEDALRSPPPTVEFIAVPSKTGEKQVRVKYRVRNAGGGIGDVRVFHNGKLIRSDGFYKEAKRLAPTQTTLVASNSAAVRGQIRNLAVLGKDEAPPLASPPKPDPHEAEIALDTVPGENEISIAAFNGTNTVQSVLKTAGFRSTRPVEEPHLYVLAIGIDRYRDPTSNLKYAVKDAEELTKQLVAQANTFYRPENIHVQVLKDSEASRANILKQIGTLAGKVKLTDGFVLFVAGHGVLHGGLYSLVTHDYDGNLGPHSLITSNELMDISKNVRSLNQLFILDTCHAGGLDNFLSGLYDARMTVLARNMGLHMYASASSAEEALDGYKGNGMFTYAVLEGLNNNRGADRNRDNRVSVVELGAYARERTLLYSKEAGHRQNPLIIGFGRDSPVYALR